MATDKRTGSGASGSAGRQRGSAGGNGATEPVFRSLANEDQAGRFIQSFADQVYPNLSAAERGAIREYQTSSYAAINRFLRTGDDYRQTESQRSADSLLDRAFTKSRMPENLTVYRVWGQGETANRLVVQAKNGMLREAINQGSAMFSDRAFNSTSARADFADNDTPRILSRIRLAAGTPALPVKTGMSSDYETEILLPRNVRQRVVDYSFNSNGTLILDIVLEP